MYIQYSGKWKYLWEWRISTPNTSGMPHIDGLCCGKTINKNADRTDTYKYQKFHWSNEMRYSTFGNYFYFFSFFQ